MVVPFNHCDLCKKPNYACKCPDDKPRMSVTMYSPVLRSMNSDNFVCTGAWTTSKDAIESKLYTKQEFEIFEK